MAVGASDADPAGFERLAQGFECGAAELRKLVEKEDALVRQADLAGVDPEAPPTRAGSEAE